MIFFHTHSLKQVFNSSWDYLSQVDFKEPYDLSQWG